MSTSSYEIWMEIEIQTEENGGFGNEALYKYKKYSTRSFSPGLYLREKSKDLLYSLISECCELKSMIVSIDEKDQNVRKTLNLGHTFGHAIESDSKNQLSHGLAVINGINMASYFSFRQGNLAEDQFKKIQETCSHLLKRKRILA